jgi:hypothetical protein
MRKLIYLGIVVTAFSSLMLAQNGPNQGGNRPNQNAANVVVLEGLVETANMYEGPPSFTMSSAGGPITIMAGPRRLLVRNSFGINVGDRLRVAAFQSPRLTGVYVAMTLQNPDTGATVTLRDSDGFPLSGRGGRSGRRSCSACYMDPSDVVSLEGPVADVHMGVGQKHPTFALSQADGTLVSILTGPYYLLLEGNFAINTGDRMAVRAYPSSQFENSYVAIELENLSTGAVLTLRDDDGIPLWGRRLSNYPPR